MPSDPATPSPEKPDEAVVAAALATSRSVLALQRKNEAELRASESRYRSIFDLAPDSLFLLSADPAESGRILDANTLAAEVHGYTRAELLRMKIGDLDVPTDAEKVPGRIARMMAGETVVFEVNHRRKDGSEFPVEVTARAVEFEGRRCILCFDRDISERRRMRAIEAREERRFRGIIEASPMPKAINDALGRITYLNRAFTDTYGYTFVEIPTLEVWWLLAYPEPDYRRWVMEAWAAEAARANLTGSAFTPLEVVIRCKNGSDKTALAHGAQFDGLEPGEHLVVLVDISAQKKTASALRAAEARWQFAIEAAGDGIWDWNVETGDVFHSPRWKSMLGYAEDELGHTVAVWESLVHADDLPAALATVTAHFEGKVEASFVEHRMKCKDGTWKWIRARGKVIEWIAPGRPRRMIGTHTDIDREKRHDEEQRLLTQRLDLAVRAGQFGTFQRDLITGRAVWSRRAFEIFGLEPQAEGPTQAEILAAVVPEDRASVLETWVAALGVDASARLEFRIRLPAGETRTIVRRRTAQRDGDGRAVVVYGLYEDVTARRTAERERLNLLQRYNTIFESVTAGLTLQRVDDAIIDCNPAAERILGLTRRQLLGLDSFDPRLRLEDSRGEPLAGADYPAIVVSRTNRPVRDFSMGVHRSDGSQVWLSVNAEPIRDRAGAVTHVVASFTDVTAQRAAEKERRKTDYLLRAALVSSRMVWWEWRVETGDFTVGSYGPDCILGYSDLQTAGYATGQAWLAKTHPDDRLEVARLLEESLAGRLDNWQCDHRLLAADGTWRWVRNLGRISERAADGAVLAMLGTTQDVHEQFGAEALARANAERLQIALNASAMGIWSYNLLTGEADWDGRELELFDLPPGQPAPTLEQFLAMLEPEDRDFVGAAWAAVDTAHPNFEYAFRVKQAGRASRHIRCVGTMRFDAAGRPEWATGINEDITSEQEKNIALNELNDRLQLALRTSRIGVWETDLRTEKVQWDDALLSIYGLERSEYEGSSKQFFEFVHPDDRERLRVEGAKVKQGEGQSVRQFRIVRRSDGAERFIEARSYVVRDAAGVPVRVVGLDRDVTEQKSAEVKQRQLEAQLFQSQKLETLGTLAGGIAHDFNNLLTGMLGFVELSQMILPPGHEAIEFLGHVRGGGLRARDLVKRLLLFARRAPESARVAIRLEALVVDTLPLISAMLPASIQITTQLAHVPGPVLADSGQMQQVLMNLVVNASHAIGKGHGKITIGVRGVEVGAGDGRAVPRRRREDRNPDETGVEVGADDGWALPPGRYLSLEVIDNGSGMDAATQAKIFDPFFTTKAQGEGTGLGLAIVHGIVGDHGGAIRVRSAPGEGATFEILLPVAPEPKETAAESATAVPVLSGAGLKVLLVDDEEPVRRFVSAALQRAGFEVESYADGSSAVRQFAAAPEEYTLALLDLSMPIRTGIEVIGDLRAIRPDLPVLLMSGDHARYGGTPDGAPKIARLAKPFLIVEFFVALKQVLDANKPAPPK